MIRGYAKLAGAVVAVAALVAGLLQGKSRRTLIACVSALAIAVTAGVALRLTAAPAGPARVERADGPVPAVETVPFVGALDALTTAPEVHYRDSAPGVGTVDVNVTNFGQLTGSVTEDGDTLQLLLAAEKLCAKLSGAGLRIVTSAGGHGAQGQMADPERGPKPPGSIPAQLVPPAQLASALGPAPAFRGRAEVRLSAPRGHLCPAVNQHPPTRRPTIPVELGVLVTISVALRPSLERQLRRESPAGTTRGARDGRRPTSAPGCHELNHHRPPRKSPSKRLRRVVPLIAAAALVDLGTDNPGKVAFIDGRRKHFLTTRQRATHRNAASAFITNILSRLARGSWK